MKKIPNRLGMCSDKTQKDYLDSINTAAQEEMLKYGKLCTYNVEESYDLEKMLEECRAHAETIGLEYSDIACRYVWGVVQGKPFTDEEWDALVNPER